VIDSHHGAIGGEVGDAPTSYGLIESLKFVGKRPHFMNVKSARSRPAAVMPGMLNGFLVGYR
jgi:hypothetical protein